MPKWTGWKNGLPPLHLRAPFDDAPPHCLRTSCYGLGVSPEFSSLVENSDIHRHLYRPHPFPTTTVFCREASLHCRFPSPLGCYISNPEVIYTSRSSYNLCWLDEQGRVTTHNQLLYPEVQVLQRKSIAQMIQGLPVRCYLVPQRATNGLHSLIFPPHTTCKIQKNHPSGNATGVVSSTYALNGYFSRPRLRDHRHDHLSAGEKALHHRILPVGVVPLALYPQRSRCWGFPPWSGRRRRNRRPKWCTPLLQIRFPAPHREPYL